MAISCGVSVNAVKLAVDKVVSKSYVHEIFVIVCVAVLCCSGCIVIFCLCGHVERDSREVRITQK